METDLQPGRQLYTESGRKRKLLSHSDSGHLVFTDFCDLLYFVLQKTTFGRIFMRQGSNAKAANLAGVNIDCTKTGSFMRFPDVWLHFPG